MNFLTANIALEVDIKRLKSQLAKAKAASTKTATSMQKSFKKMSKASDRAFSAIVKAAKYAAAAILAVGIASVKMAADIEDSEDFFVMSMGNMADSTRQWSEELADALHINQYEVRETVATFNEMITSMGMAGKAAATMSQRYTQLSYDLVSYHPKVKDLVQASTVLQAALTGERETLKRLGYYYSENEVKLEAIRLGYGKNLQALTALQKAEINDVILMKKMKNVHGDLNRTLASSQNVFRAVWTQVKLLSAEFGEELRPRITEVATALRDWIKENKTAIVDWAKVWTEKIEAIVQWFVKWRKEIGYTVVALGGLAIITKITGWVLALRAAVWGASIATGAWAASWVTTMGIFTHFAKGKTATEVIAGLQKLSPGKKLTKWVFNLYRIKTLLPLLAKGALALAAAWGAWQIGKAVKTLWEWHKAASAAREATDRLERVMLRITTKGRLEAEGLLGDFPLIKAAKEYAEILKLQRVYYSNAQKMAMLDVPVPTLPGGEEVTAFLAEQKLKNQRELNLKLLEERKIRLDTTENAVENYGVMMSALQFELKHLGEMDDMRERAATYAQVELEINNMLLLSAEERNQKLTAYMDLFDRLQEKQASFSHNIRLWMNRQAEYGKNLAEVFVNAFDTMADRLADALMKMGMDWKAFGRMFIQQLLAMIIKLQIAFALQTAMGFAGAVTPTQATGINPTASPVGGLQHGGEVLQTGLAIVHKGEKFSGVNNEMGFGGITVNNYLGDTVDVEVMDEEQVINITRKASIQMAAFDGEYQRAHRLG
jgi:hypothetical protein